MGSLNCDFPGFLICGILELPTEELRSRELELPPTEEEASGTASSYRREVDGERAGELRTFVSISEILR